MKRLLLLLLVLGLLPVPAFARFANDPYANQWSYSKIGTTNAWDISTGSRDVVVAIIDNGFDHFHQDLKDNAWVNTDEIPANNIDDDNNGYVDDVYGWNFVAEDRNNDGVISSSESWGSNNPRPPVVDVDPESRAGQVLHHGSVVAGIIGAVGNNRKLGTGINWEVQLMNLRLIDNDGRGQTTALGRALRYAVDNGADVINFSIVSNDNSESVQEAIDYAYDHGVVIVAAAGNNAMSLNTTPLYPICSDTGLADPRVLGVSAIGEDRRLASFSNYGSDCIDITAPGIDIGSTLRYGPEDGYSDEYGFGWSGTSFAAPFVSATAALIKAIQPAWTNKEIYQTILESTDKTPPTDELAYANLFGRGLLQVDKALELAKAATLTPPDTTPNESKIEPSPVVTAPSVIKPNLHLVSLSEGLVRVKYLNRLGLGTTIHVPELKYADDVTQYIGSDGNIFYASVSYLEEGELSKIVVFNGNWDVLSELLIIDEHAGSHIALADVTGDTLPEVILAPLGHRSERYRVYDMYSDEDPVSIVTHEDSHKGAVIHYVPGGNEKDSIVVAFQTENETVIEHYAADTRLMKRFTTEQLDQPGAIVSADLEGDGGYEIVLASAKSEESKVAMYRLSDGQLLKSFPGYVTGGNIAIRLSSGDYNGDGADDILASGADTPHPMRIWNKRLRRLLEIPIVEQSLFPTHAFLVPSKEL